MQKREENKNNRRDKSNFKKKYAPKVLGLPLGKNKYERNKKQPKQIGCFLFVMAV